MYQFQELEDIHVYGIVPGMRLSHLTHFYMTNHDNCTVVIKDFSKEGSDCDHVGRKIMEQLKQACKEYHVDHEEEEFKPKIRKSEAYEEAFMKELPLPMTEQDMIFRVSHVAMAKASYQEALQKSDELRCSQKLTSNGEDKVSVQLQILRGTMDTNYSVWNSGQAYIDNYVIRHNKDKTDMVVKALKQHGEDCDAFDRKVAAKLNVKKVLVQMLKTCPASVKQLLTNLENNGDDPYQDNDFFKLIKRLEKRYGAQDEISTTALLVKSMNAKQGTQTLGQWNNICIKMGNDLRKTMPDGYISRDNLLATIMLRGMDPIYMDRYLAAMTQMNLQKNNMESEMGEADDNASIPSLVSHKPPDLLSFVQNFIESEIKKQLATETMASMAPGNNVYTTSTKKAISSGPLVVCAASPATDPVILKTQLLVRYNVCPEEFTTPGSCVKGSKCEGYHLPPRTKNFCGKYLQGACTRNPCYHPHISPVSGGTKATKSSATPSSAASKQVFPVAEWDDEAAYSTQEEFVVNVCLAHSDSDDSSTSDDDDYEGMPDLLYTSSNSSSDDDSSVTVLQHVRLAHSDCDNSSASEYDDYEGIPDLLDDSSDSSSDEDSSIIVMPSPVWDLDNNMCDVTNAFLSVDYTLVDDNHHHIAPRIVPFQIMSKRDHRNLTTSFLTGYRQESDQSVQLRYHNDFMELQNLEYPALISNQHPQDLFTADRSAVLTFIRHTYQLYLRHMDYDKLLLLRIALTRTKKELGPLFNGHSCKSIQAYLLYLNSSRDSQEAISMTGNKSLQDIEETLVCWYGHQFNSYMTRTIGSSGKGLTFARYCCIPGIEETMLRELDSAYFSMNDESQHNTVTNPPPIVFSTSEASDVPIHSPDSNFITAISPGPTLLYLPYLWGIIGEHHVTLAIMRFYYDLTFGSSSHLSDSALDIWVNSNTSFRSYVDLSASTFHVEFWNVIFTEDFYYCGGSECSSFFDDTYITTFRAYYQESDRMSDDDITNLILTTLVGDPAFRSINLLCLQLRGVLKAIFEDTYPLVLMLHFTDVHSSEATAYSPTSPIYSNLDDSVTDITSPIYSITPCSTEIDDPPKVVADCCTHASFLYCLNYTTGLYEHSIGKGLFANRSFTVGEQIAMFSGQIITKLEMDVRTAAGRGGYMVCISKNRFLDGYHPDPNLICLANMANSPSHCYDRSTNKPAVANCRLIRGIGGRPCYLKSTKSIPLGTEILYHYGATYRMPDRHDTPTAVCAPPTYDALQQELIESRALVLRLQNTILTLTGPGSCHNPINIDSIPPLTLVLTIPSTTGKASVSTIMPPPIMAVSQRPPHKLGWDSLSALNVVGSASIPFPSPPSGPSHALGIGGLTRIVEEGLCPELDPSLIFQRIEGNTQNLLSIGSVLQPSTNYPLGGFAIFTASGAVRGNVSAKTRKLITDLLDTIESDGDIIAHAVMERNVYYQRLPPTMPLPVPVYPATINLYGGRVRTKNIDQLLSFLAATGLSRACLVSGISTKGLLGLPPYLSIPQINDFFSATGKNKFQLLADITVPALVHPLDYHKLVPSKPGEFLDFDAFDPSYSRMRRSRHINISTTSTSTSEASLSSANIKGPLVVIPSINGGFKDAVVAYDPCSGYISVKGRTSSASPHTVLLHYVDLWTSRWNSITTVRTDSSFVTVASVDHLSKRVPPIAIIQAPPGDHRRVTAAAEGIIRWIQQGGQANMNRLRPLVANGLISDETARSFWFYATVQSSLTMNMNPAIHDASITRFECGTGIQANLSYQVLLPFGLPIIGKSPEPHSDGRGEEGIYLGPSMIVPSGVIFYSLRTGKISIKFAFTPTPKSLALTQRDVTHITNQLFGSAITLSNDILPGTDTSFTDILDESNVSSTMQVPQSYYHSTRSKSSGIRDLMSQTVYLLTDLPNIFVIQDDVIVDLSARGPKPIVPPNKVCMADPLWDAADNREISKLNEEDTFFPLAVDSSGRFLRPPNAIVLPMLRVREYKWKLDPHTQKSRWLECVRFVINGSQDKRIIGDYYAHTPDRTIFLLICSIDCTLAMSIYTGDVERAYLNALSLDPNIVVLAPTDVKGLDRESLLNKGLYGTRKAALGWEGWIEDKFVNLFQFHKMNVARGVYLHPFHETGESVENSISLDPNDSISLLPESISVVDLPITPEEQYQHGHMKILRHSDDFYSSSSESGKQESKHAFIEQNIRMSKFSVLSKFLGCDFVRYDMQGHKSANGTIVLVYQKDFINEMVVKFQYLREIFNPANRKRNHPVPINAMLTDEELVGDSMNLLNTDQVRMYQEVVGSINWLVCSTRPESKFGCFIVARRLVQPRNWDMYLAIHIIDFIIGTINIPLVLGGSIVDPILYADASFAPLPDRRSICAHLVISGEGSGCIYAHVSAPKCAVTSIFEAELIAGNNAATTAIYITKACQEMHYEISKRRVIFVDNEAEIHWISGSVSNKRSKHVDIRLYASRHLQDQGHVLFKYVETKLQLADILTKALCVTLFRSLAFILLGHGLIYGLNIPGVELYA